MTGKTRREFLKHSAVAAAAGPALLTAPTTTWAKPLGANDDVRIAVVGFRGKGRHHIGMFRGLEGVRVVALCDPDHEVLDAGVQDFRKRKEHVAAYTDVRLLLENKDVDAVVTASPNHWHSLIGVWACQAGKDVYVEKPCSHNVWEGRKLLEAARKYDRIVQHGTQSRSDEGLREALEYIKAGNLGKIVLSRGLCYKSRDSIGKVAGPQQPPPYLDYDVWAGPAPLKPLMRTQLHYDWHWVWDTGNGDIGNQGVHEMDIARWALGEDRLPRRVMSVGGRFAYDDDAETANTQFAIYDYEEAPLIFEVRGLPRKDMNWKLGRSLYRGISVGNVVHCEGGYFAGAWVYDKDGKKLKQFPRHGAEHHQANFIKALRSRKKEDLHAEVHDAHLSAALCHLGNISYRLGQEVRPEEVTERFSGDSDGLETFERFKEHLAVNGVDVAKSLPTLGPWLDFCPKRERFVGFGSQTRKANALLTRDYREPYVVPDSV